MKTEKVLDLHFSSFFHRCCWHLEDMRLPVSRFALVYLSKARTPIHQKLPLPLTTYNLQLTTHNKQEQKVPIHIIFTTIKTQSCSARRPFHSNKMMSISSIHRPMLLATSSSESSSEPPAKKREWTTVSICLDERTNNDEYLVGVK
jgi:hypothetical protein